MTETIRALIMSAAALSPLAVWWLVPGIELKRVTALAVCAVVIVGVALAWPVKPDKDEG